MVVAGHHEHPALRRGAGAVGVADHVAAAVEPGALAVPEGRHPLDAPPRVHPDLLRAPAGGGGQVLVHRRGEADALPLQVARARQASLSRLESGEPR